MAAGEWWLAYYLDGDPAKGLIEAIQGYNTRTGLMPRAVAVSPKSPNYQRLAETAKRLGLEVLEHPLPPRDIWLGPIVKEEQSQ